jgi:hypothetical protein
MFENRFLIFGCNRMEMTEGWRRLNSVKPRNLYASPNIIRVIKSRRMNWAGRVFYMGKIN